MIVGSVFSGIGMLDYGLSLAGIEHAWFCESDPWRREILAKRWPGRPVFADVRAVGAHNAERVDGIVGGFPCKGASTAGKRNGFDHPETVLWREMFRAIGELQPRVVVVENVANLLAVRDGAVWGEVLGDLASLGFGVVWDCIPAAAFGAPHRRDRVIAIATHADGAGEWRDGSQRRVADGRPDARGGDRSTVANSDESQADADAAAGRPRSAVGQRDRSVADADRWRRCASTAINSSESARPYSYSHRPGLRVEWGQYGPAVERWERIRGRAPEPLVRRVDDRAAARVERSRLSALGDGVQVQLGELVGRYLMNMELEAVA